MISWGKSHFLLPQQVWGKYKSSFVKALCWRGYGRYEFPEENEKNSWEHLKCFHTRNIRCLIVYLYYEVLQRKECCMMEEGNNFSGELFSEIEQLVSTGNNVFS